MSDIFLSYAREDSDWAQRLAASLERAGLSVWWDQRLRAGDAFDDVIQREVDAARAVLVLWSKHAVSSVWVKGEATAAQQQNKLVPVLVEPVRIPIPFGAFHTADMTGWDGSEDHPKLLGLIGSLLDRLDGQNAPQEDGTSERDRDDSEWHATLLASEPARRRLQLRIGTRRHELECVFRPNYLWNRFVVIVDGQEVAKGGHQYRDSIGFSFPLGDDWIGFVNLASGDTVSTGELLGHCEVSIGGRVLYREPASGD